MKRTALLIVLLVASMSVVACGKKEEAQAPAPEKAAETAAVAVTEKAAEVGAQADEKAAESAAQVEEKAAEVAAEVKEEAVEAAAEVKEEAVEAAAATEKAAQAATEEAAQVAAKVEEKVADAAQAAAETASVDNIVIENTYGKVTFNHKVHAESFDCALCHGEGEPGALDMGKEKAHAACKGCHQEQGAGPVKCSECHVK
jgi:hypothetical protein